LHYICNTLRDVETKRKSIIQLINAGSIIRVPELQAEFQGQSKLRVKIGSE